MKLSLSLTGGVFLAIAALTIGAALSIGTAAQVPQVAIDDDDIAGQVIGQAGPEAGVWVIAETTNLPQKFSRSVVTDDQVRYLIPDLPEAQYKIWVRGYGLVDSPPSQNVPGTIVNLPAWPAKTPQEAAQYYPAIQWFSLIDVPAK